MAREVFVHVETRLSLAEGEYYSPLGYARYENLTPYLDSFDSVNVMGRVAHEGTDGFRVTGPGVSVVEAPFYEGASGFIRTLPKTILYVAMLPIANGSVVVARMGTPLATLLYCKAKSARAKFILQVVGDPAEAMAAGVFGPIGKLIAKPARLLIRLQVKRADAAIFVTREALQAKYPLRDNAISLARSNVELAPSSFRSEPRVYTERTEGSAFRIVTIGSHAQKFKGHDILLRALKDVREAGSDVRLTIIGGGRYSPLYRQMADELGIASYVEFTGQVGNRAEINGHLERADVFVLPSLTEGLSRALIEAMAQGIACAASDVGGARELLPADALFEADSVDALSGAIASLVTASPSQLSQLALHGYRSAEYIRDFQSGDLVLREFVRKL